MSLFFSSARTQKGFTLVELMVTVTIMASISALVIFNQTKYTDDISLNQVADDISLALRQAQIYGISVKEFSAGDFTAAYGVSFNIVSGTGSRTDYIYFADRGTIKNGIYDNARSCPVGGTSECIEKTVFRTGNSISGICVIMSNGNENCGLGGVDVTFRRPETKAVLIYKNSAGNPASYGSPLGARIQLVSTTGATSSVTVYETGQISVQ